MMIKAKAKAKAEAEAEAGRVAADRISDEWDDRAWVPQSPTYEWAHAAIERLSELFAGQRGMFKASLEGAERGARSLSPRPFQGLVECLQNADDLGATCLQIAYRSLPTPELLIAHNGAPVTLANVAGMLLPWLSTKKDDADAAGRFGIGQRTLGSLGGPISVHAPPFHFSIYSSGPQVVTPYPDVPGVYQASRRDTLLTIPLFDSVSAEKVAEAVQQLNVDALLFLRSIRTLQFNNLEDPAQNLSFSVEVTPRPGSTISFDGAVTPVEIVDVALCRPAGRPMVYRRYSTHRPIRSTTTRANKATGATTPIGICVPLQAPQDALPLYDRMPLPVQSGLFIGLNAQFDPDAARSTLIPNDWNRDRFKDLGHLTSWAALEYFESGDVAGWNHIPLAAEVNNSGSWIAEQVLDLVVEASHTILMDSLTVLTAAGSTPIDELAYEIAELEQLLDEYDIERLCEGKVALPRTQRDGPGRWRPVLAELGRSTVVDVEDALDILNGDTARPANWYVIFASIVEQHDLVKEFTSRQSLLLADGTTTGLPAAAENWVLVKSALPNSLTARLGFTRQLHPAYFVEGAGVEAFLAGLKKRHVLFDNQDVPTDVFQILKRGSVKEGATLTAIRLHEPELLALRDAWAELQRDQRDAIGIRVGQRVELKAFWYLPGGKRVTGWSRLAELYMPAAVDRDTDSFAKAAGKTPGLKWVDGEYAKILKPSVSRASLGARSLLSAWGVAREPRLIRPLDEASVWARDTRPASPVRSKIRTPDHLESIQLTGSYGYLLNDHWSPDADAVVEDIARSPVKVGRVRGEALLAVLSRAWEKRYADAALTQPVNGSQGYWHPGTEVRATWLARLAAVKWLPDAGNSLQRPSSLRLQAPGASTKPGERSTTLARVDSQIYRSGVLPALAVRAGPTQQELVQQLRALRNEQVTPDIAGEALAIYQLLSASLRSRSEAAPEGRMTSSQFKNAFRGSVKERGLLLVDGQWHSPESLLRGPAIFGEYKTFAPHVEGLEQLWVALGVPLPSATDAISVLREISSTSATPSPEDLGVMIRAFTLLADGMASLTTQMRTSLRRLPLWTGTAWTKDRPVYALEGDSLQDVAPPTIRVWRLGLSTFGPIKSALDTLGVVHLSLPDFKAESGTALGVAEGEAIRPKFAKAIALLRQEFVRSDQGLLDGLCLSWDNLATATVVINPNLTIVADLPSGPLRLPARAHINRDPLYLVLRCPEEAATDLGAGAAIASLFHGDQKKISWAWAAVWPRAVYGEQAQGAILRSTRAEQADDASRLDKLAEQVGERSARKKPVGKTGAAASNLMSPPVQVRKLKDLEDLLPSMGTIVNPGAKPRGDLVFGKRRSSTKTREFDPTALVPASTQAAHRSVLPPTDEREKLALEVVMRALRLDHHQLNDLRDIRGVGVDAIDELRQCYEIKMSSGAGIPNEITLTAREVEAAREDPDFFLAIVSGLEDGAGKLRVNFIFDPLSRLDVKVSSDLTLTGIKDAEKLEFEFNKA